MTRFMLKLVCEALCKSAEYTLHGVTASTGIIYYLKFKSVTQNNRVI